MPKALVSNHESGVKAEDGDVADRSNRAAFVGRRQSMSRVLDHSQAALARHRHDGVHIACLASEMHREYRLRLGPFAGGLGQFVRIDIEGVGIDVHEYRIAAEIPHHLGGGGKGKWGRQHLVAGPNADRLERQMQACGRGVDRDTANSGIAVKRTAPGR